MKINVYRFDYNTEGDRNIIGAMHIDGEFFCWTLEDEKRADGVKVKHKTAIPTGKYEVIVNRSNRFKRQMPLLLKVPMFEGIRIHGGNTSKNTSGCILVAKNRSDYRIQGTEEKRLTKLLIDVQNKGEEITIEITDNFLSYDAESKTKL